MTDNLTPREFSFDVDADLETVWAALTTPQGLSSWYVSDAKVEAVEGGALEVDWGTGEYAMGTFDLVDAPHRLRLAYATDDGQPTGTEEWLLSSGDGVTHVRLIHSLPVAEGATWDDTYPDIVRGWSLFMGTLEWLFDQGHPLGRRATVSVGPMPSGNWHLVLEELGLRATPDPGTRIETSVGIADVVVAADDFSLLLGFEGGTLLVDVEGPNLYTLAATYGEERPDLLDRLAAAGRSLCSAVAEPV